MRKRPKRIQHARAVRVAESSLVLVLVCVFVTCAALGYALTKSARRAPREVQPAAR